MTITRPINSNNDETLSMPTSKSAPDSSPTFLANFFNRIFNAIAHWHNDGTTNRPAYLKDGGAWGYADANNRLFTFLFRDVAGIKKDLPFFKVFPGPVNAVAFAVGHAEPLPDGLTDLNDLVEPGDYTYYSISHAPLNMGVGIVSVRKFFFGTQSYIIQIAYGGEGQIAIRRNPPVNNLLPAGNWGNWSFVNFGSGGGGSGGGGGGVIGDAIFHCGTEIIDGRTVADGRIMFGLDYPDALISLGNRFGGDGVETFGLPDMRNDPPIGKGRWQIVIGSDNRAYGRFFCGIGVFCGDHDLYPGKQIII